MINGQVRRYLIWKGDGGWYQLTGGAENGKGATQIWSSPDLEKWTYQKKEIYSSDPGNYWELPDLNSVRKEERTLCRKRESILDR